MSWSTTATLPSRQHGPGWTISAAPPDREHGPGWFAASPRLAPLTGSGALSATVTAAYPQGTAVLGGTGTLTATLKPVKTVSATFSGAGGLAGRVNETKPVTAAFTAAGELATAVNDGLWAIITGGAPLLPDDGLTATVTAVTGGTAAVTANLAAGGSLTATVIGYEMAQGFLTATVTRSSSAAAVFAATATLLAVTVTPMVPIAATLSGGGTLTAAVTSKLPIGAVLAADGALTAAGVQRYPIPALFGDIPGIVTTNLDLTAEGMLTATVTKAATGITDDFNRADSSTGLGSGWTNRNAVMGVSSNTAYGVNAGAWNLASHNTTMASDDMEASMTLGPYSGTQDYTMVLIGNNTAGEGVFVYTNEVGANFNICSQPDWTVANYVVQASSPFASWTAGDVLKLKRVGNVYTVYLNNVSQVSWTDNTNVVPRDSSHRLVAIGAYNNGSGSRTIDSFAAL